jgi:sulfoxide reductase catalytic subunit YedY
MKEYLESPLKDEITPEKLYFSRRKFLRLSATIGVTAALAACGVTSLENPTPGSEGTPTATETPLPDVETPYDTIIHYNNFYEFSTDKGAVANMVSEFQTEPWTVEIGGLVDNPVTLTADEIIQKYPASEHVYRLRCVEGWSMVVPWNGFSLNRLLADVGVQPAAKFIAFTTVLRPSQMPGQNDAFFTWPYEEGLRLDEAMHDLTLLVSGLYGKPLPKQDGAPLRIVVPWKYGFKSIKSIVKIEAVADQPRTFWNTTAPNEYGFYSNVNPNVPHPRWTQYSERRLGESGRRPTLLFNGYNEVAPLYEGMDLKVNF